MDETINIVQSKTEGRNIIKSESDFNPIERPQPRQRRRIRRGLTADKVPFNVWYNESIAFRLKHRKTTDSRDYYNIQYQLAVDNDFTDRSLSDDDAASSRFTKTDQLLKTLIKGTINDSDDDEPSTLSPLSPARATRRLSASSFGSTLTKLSSSESNADDQSTFNGMESETSDNESVSLSALGTQSTQDIDISHESADIAEFHVQIASAEQKERETEKRLAELRIKTSILRTRYHQMQLSFAVKKIEKSRLKVAKARKAALRIREAAESL